jgi:putative transposase
VEVKQRRAAVDRRRPSLSVVRQCKLLNISRSGLYYQPATVSENDLELMKLIDRQFMVTPFYGTRKMAVWLKSEHYSVNRKHVRRLMRLMGLKAIYRHPRTSPPGPGNKIYPYLLNGMKITRPNQVWCADITYIPMAHGFMYLLVIMDWYSRYVLAWRLSNTLDSEFCVEALEEAFREGRPDIFNTDQGSQFTGKAFTGLLEQHRIKISMDGKGSYRDNLFIERLWRTVKYEEVYLKAYQNGKDARIGISDYFRFYNTARPHQALGYRTPGEVFTSIPFEEPEKGVIESLTTSTTDAAGLYLNLAPLLS